MDLIDQLRSIADRAAEQVDRLATEEATKNALVMPFINALGYNVFDPTEVVPEFTADVGIKKGEKVDYAIMRDGRPVILFECKIMGTDLERAVPSQLFRYFAVTDARLAICTDGIRYRFFSDLEKPNRMDERPFLDFSLLHLQPDVVGELKKLTKAHFDLDAILEAASELKYTSEIKRTLAQQMESPDEDFVKLLAARVIDGRITRSVREQFQEVVRKAFRGFIREQVQERLQAALDDASGAPPLTMPPARPAGEEEPEDDVVTTAEELEGFFIVKSILREAVDAHRIVARDVRSYYGILLDDNNRKPLARLHFQSKTKYIGLFDNADKQEDRIKLDTLDDIYQYRERLLATPAFYDDTIDTSAAHTEEDPLATGGALG